MSCDVFILGHADHWNTAGDAPVGCDVATEDHVALAVEQLILGGESAMLQVHAAHLNSQPIPNAAVLHDRDHGELRVVGTVDHFCFQSLGLAHELYLLFRS